MLSTRSQNAICFLSSLSEFPENTLVSLQEITDKEGLPHAYLEQIIPTLKKAGFVTSHRGAFGGYKLAKPASKISIWDIVSILEPQKPSPGKSESIINELYEITKKHLSKTKLSDIK